MFNQSWAFILNCKIERGNLAKVKSILDLGFYSKMQNIKYLPIMFNQLGFYSKMENSEYLSIRCKQIFNEG
jgi:hypothetical protein